MGEGIETFRRCPDARSGPLERVEKGSLHERESGYGLCSGFCSDVPVFGSHGSDTGAVRSDHQRAGDDGDGFHAARGRDAFRGRGSAWRPGVASPEATVRCGVPPALPPGVVSVRSPGAPRRSSTRSSSTGSRRSESCLIRPANVSATAWLSNRASSRIFVSCRTVAVRRAYNPPQPRRHLRQRPPPRRCSRPPRANRRRRRCSPQTPTRNSALPSAGCGCYVASEGRLRARSIRAKGPP